LPTLHTSVVQLDHLVGTRQIISGRLWRREEHRESNRSFHDRSLAALRSPRRVVRINPFVLDSPGRAL
jgi:hypothetical protein